MTTINIKAAVVRQALEALKHPVGVFAGSWQLKCDAAITALRQELEAAGTVERYAVVYEFDTPFGLHRSFDYAPYNGTKPTRAVEVYTTPPADAKKEPVVAVPEALLKWAYSPELVETGNNWQQGYEHARAWVHVQLSCNDHPAPKDDAKDARIAELEKDAARYRWLRDKATTNDWAEIGSIQAIPPSKVDAAIDAAMKEKP